MAVPEFDALLASLRYAAPRWSQVFDPDRGPYNAITGDRYEPMATLLLAPYGVRTWATLPQVNKHVVTLLGEPVDTFSIRIGHEHEDKRFIVPYRTRTVFPVVKTSVGITPAGPFPTEACTRILAKYGAKDALRPGYEEYAVRALVGYVVDEKVGAGVLRRAFVEEIAATFAMYILGITYPGIREDLISTTATKLKPIEFAHDLATATATASVVVAKLGLKRE